MRKKQDFVVKGKRVFIGLEDSLKNWKLCVRSEGMIIQEVTLPADYHNLQSYLINGYPECRISVMYEAGFRGFWLHDLLKNDGVDCIVIPAHKVTQEKDCRVKTDKIDARRLAKNLENADYSSCWVPDRELREDRQLCRTQLQIQRSVTSFKARIRMFFHFHGLQMPQGQWSQEHYRKLAELQLSVPLRKCLDAYLRMLEELEEVSKQLKKEMRTTCRKERYQESTQTKESCPGIASLSAVRLTLECGDLSRFENGKQFSSYLGLTSREHTTGDKTRRGSITRQGSGQLRAWMIECAWTAIRIDPVLLKKFQRVWQNSGSKKKAIVAVARKLACRIHALEMNRERYQTGVVR